MAKIGGSGAKAGNKAAAERRVSTEAGKKNFEERLERLEELGEKIRGAGIPLDEALAAFEEGIKLARALEKELEKIESRVEILMNNPDAREEEEPDLGLFDGKE